MNQIANGNKYHQYKGDVSGQQSQSQGVGNMIRRRNNSGRKWTHHSLTPVSIVYKRNIDAIYSEISGITDIDSHMDTSSFGIYARVANNTYQVISVPLFHSNLPDTNNIPTYTAVIAYDDPDRYKTIFYCSRGHCISRTRRPIYCSLIRCIIIKLRWMISHCGISIQNE